MNNTHYMHFSFDDVYICLADLSKNADIYTSVYENKFFALLKSLNEKYGAVFSLYLFNNAVADDYSLSNVTGKFRKEFSEASGWLRFGFHAEEVETNYNKDGGISKSYNSFCNSVITKLGGVNSIDNFIRLGYFGGTSDNIDELLKCDNKISGLLSADDERISYYLDDETNTHLINNCATFDTEKDLVLIRSQKRLEEINSLPEMFECLDSVKTIGNTKILEIFTHEQCFNEMVINNMVECIKWAKCKGYEFVFTEDIIDMIKDQLAK